MSRAQSYIYQILSRPPNTKIAGPTTHSTFHTWLSKKIGPTKWPAKKREGRKKMTLMILKFLTWESGESKKISIFPPKINRRIVAIFWHENWITEFQIDWKIGKLIHFFAKNPKLFFWIFAPKMAKISLLIFGVKIETFKVSLLDFQGKNSKILPE